MIEISDLTYTYPRALFQTIKGMDFTIQHGEIFGLLGPSGAGKSTTQNILIGMLKGYGGQVLINGTELSKMTNTYLETIGVAFEFPNFYTHFTALENLHFFGSLYACDKENPLQLLEKFGLQDDAHTRFSNFSKGMKVRLNVCRALLHKPNLLFLDEPTSGLDPVHAEIMTELILQKKREGVTTIVTTHDMQVAETICDRVAFVVDGKIVLIQSPRELKIQHGKQVVHVEYRENKQLKTAVFSLKNIGMNRTFIDLLKSKKIETIHSQETTLGDIFIKVTGRSLDENLGIHKK